MFESSLIESANLQKTRGSWRMAMVSVVAHTIFIVALVVAGMYMTDNSELLEKPIEAFLVSPAPPPPPPPAGSGSGRTTPTPTPVEPQTPREQFVAPTNTAEVLPEVEIDEGTGDKGVIGGVEGGVEGGVVGGEIGGVIGGVLGGTLGGTGDQPLRVGGNVKPPEIVHRVEPNYTEDARRSRVQGVVILEAIIDAQGNVTDVRIIKTLADGLGEEAAKAVRQWKFRPGTQNGKPVPVIFSLTVNFRLQ